MGESPTLISHATRSYGLGTHGPILVSLPSRISLISCPFQNAIFSTAIKIRETVAELPPTSSEVCDFKYLSRRTADISDTSFGMSVRIFALLTCILAFPQLFLSKHVCAAPKMLRTAPAFQSLHLAIDRMVLRIQIPSSILPQ